VQRVSTWKSHERRKKVIGYGCAWPCGDVFSTALRKEGVQVCEGSANDAGRVSMLSQEGRCFECQKWYGNTVLVYSIGRCSNGREERRASNGLTSQ